MTDTGESGAGGPGIGGPGIGGPGSGGPGGGGPGTDARGAEQGWQRARTILDELVEAARNAALSIADEQRRLAADQIAGLAGAAHAAAQALGGGSNVRSARCAAQTAATIDRFADAVRQRRWNDIVADAESFARREPRLFTLGAAALGYIAGRMLRSSAKTEAAGAARAAIARQTAAVTAAVSSSAGNGELAGKARGGPGQHEIPGHEIPGHEIG